MRKLLVLLVALFLVGCAFLSPKQGLVLDLVAQNAGYVTAKQNADIGESALKLCNVKDLSFESWSNQVVELFVKDEFLAMNFKKMLTAVEVDVKGLAKLKDRIKVYDSAKQNFCHGLGVGLQKKP